MIPNHYFTFFFFLALIVVVAAQLPQLPPPPILKQPDEPAVCSLVDILMSQRNPEIELKEYFCYSF